jgi:hypothetical protein
MKYLSLFVLIAFSCQNEKPYLTNTDTSSVIIGYTPFSIKIDTIYIHDTIIDAVYKPKKKQKNPVIGFSGQGELSSGNPNTAVGATTEIPNEVLRGYIDSDTLDGGQYYIGVINKPTGTEIEVNYSIESKMLIGWDGKHYVLCGVDDWGGCSVHIYHKTLREILDSAKQK